MPYLCNRITVQVYIVKKMGIPKTENTHLKVSGIVLQFYAINPKVVIQKDLAICHYRITVITIYRITVLIDTHTSKQDSEVPKIYAFILAFNLLLVSLLCHRLGIFQWQTLSFDIEVCQLLKEVVSYHLGIGLL